MALYPPALSPLLSNGIPGRNSPTSPSGKQFPSLMPPNTATGILGQVPITPPSLSTPPPPSGGIHHTSVRFFELADPFTPHTESSEGNEKARRFSIGGRFRPKSASIVSEGTYQSLEGNFSGMKNEFDSTSSVNSQRRFKCDRCGKEMSSKGALNTHLRIHSGEKPHICEIDSCGKQFRTKDSLTKHQRVHSGDKPYQCEACGKRFTQNSSWRLHMRIHTGDRPYQCDICSRSFTQKGNLMAHQRVHTGEKPFECTENGCGKRFAQQGQLKKHMKCHYLGSGVDSADVDLDLDDDVDELESMSHMMPPNNNMMRPNGVSNNNNNHPMSGTSLAGSRPIKGDQDAHIDSILI